MPNILIKYFNNMRSNKQIELKEQQHLAANFLIHISNVFFFSIVADVPMPAVIFIQNTIDSLCTSDYVQVSIN